MVLHYGGGLCGQVGRGGRYGVLRRHHATRSGINLATTVHRRCRTRPLAGASKIQYTGHEPENYFIEEDDWDLEDRDFLLLCLALETVSLPPGDRLTNRLCLAAPFIPPTTSRSNTPK
jgi:hypothetical protein